MNFSCCFKATEESCQRTQCSSKYYLPAPNQEDETRKAMKNSTLRKSRRTCRNEQLERQMQALAESTPFNKYSFYPNEDRIEWRRQW